MEYPRKATSLEDDEIEQLLKQAEVRLRSQSSAIEESTTSQHTQHPEQTGLPAPYIKNKDDAVFVDEKILVSEQERQASGIIRKIEDPVARREKQIQKQKATAGSNWFDLPRTKLTPQLKRDLQIIRMRSVLDSKRFYKKDNSRASVPEYSQVGTMIEGPTDFFSARIPNKSRENTLAEQVMAGERETGKFKSKYNEIQASKRSGKRGHYRAQMRARYGKKFNG